MAPEELAEPWDNCGLLIDSDNEYVSRIVVCLDINHAVVNEAINCGAELIISHHPLIFKPLKRLSGDGAQSFYIRELIKNGVAVYAAHTNVDKTYGGLNDLLAGIIGLDAPISYDENDHPGYYRIGSLPRALAAGEFNEYVRTRMKLRNLTATPIVKAIDTSEKNMEYHKLIKKVVVMCGAYDLDADQVLSMGADAVVCGEMRYHEALDLAGMGVHVVQAGHHGTERFFMSLIDKWIKDKYPDIGIICAGFSDPPLVLYDGADSLYDL
jgi:dinuclear metal center YbgI/SA1388 family protein